jgi:hypothetical protein
MAEEMTPEQKAIEVILSAPSDTEEERIEIARLIDDAVAAYRKEMLDTPAVDDIT